MYLERFLLIFCFVLCGYGRTDTNTYGEGGSGRNETRRRVLSRSKRYLVFPTGSSLQLVFCVQTSALIPVGDIFLYGSTVALAWNLPTDPKLLLLLKDKENYSNRRADETSINYVDEKGKLIARVPYTRRTIVNPAFAKRSVDVKMMFKKKLKGKLDRIQMHERQAKREYLKKHQLDEHSIEFHRSNRIELYEKLAPLITTLGGDGRQCVLYKLCESAKISKQGTFLQEMLRVVFTLPKGDSESGHYDKAHSAQDDCRSLYPRCYIDTYS